MSFIWPAMLVLLLLLPLCAVLYLRLQRRRQQLLARYRGFGAIQGSAGRQAGLRRHIPPALFLAGLAILVLALARPQAVVNLPRVKGTVILAFDVSGSMAATDLQPNRMEAAKAVARDFVQRQPASVRIGVVAFSEGGFAVQSPTNDQEAILAAIDRIEPQRGTSLGQGILASLATIAGGEQAAAPNGTATAAPTQQTNASTAIVLLSDGENTGPPDPFEAALAAANQGVRIYPVGIGSPSGITLELEGFSVHTQLDEATLQGIADLTNGTYYNAASQADLQTIYQNIDLELVIEPEAMEITSLLAGVGLLILLIGALCSLLWFSRVP
jgi:Ca-activated chloride channel family protein